MEKFINLLKNRYFKCILIVIIAILCLKLYTNYLFESLNNETPREAIVEFIYDETHSWKSFFIEIEESKNIDKTDENSLYYNIKYTIFKKTFAIFIDKSEIAFQINIKCKNTTFS